jgi:cell division protease FtsH
MPLDNKNRPNPIKKTPGLFFFVSIFLLFLLLFQPWGSEQQAKVAFSHQLEHLVNLDLLQPKENYKIAQNEHLVTITGKFREQPTQEAKNRFHYLELLNTDHQLQQQKELLSQDLNALQNSVFSSAEWFIQISGLSVPKEGWTVIGSYYDTQERLNAVRINPPAFQNPNLKNLLIVYQKVQENPNNETIDELGSDLLSLLQLYRSSKLGIGVESYKQELKELDQTLSFPKNAASSEKLQAYGIVFTKLQKITQDLIQEQNYAKLLPLRSVRNYLETIEQYNKVQESLEKNNLLLDKARESVAQVVWFFNNQEVSTRTLEKQDQELFSHWFVEAKKEWENFNTNKTLPFKAPDQQRNAVLEKTFQSQEPSPNYLSYLITLLPIFVIGLVLYFVFARQVKGVGSSAMNFGKSPARLWTKDTNKITFKDVAGIEEAKEELKEIVDFLKDPDKFTALGARIPKGVLLVGPPGTGKTLVAKAVAGEADRPFFSISGSDFVEMFVGVGASRIRDLFDQAKKNAPCIIFMDEIDAVGRHRGAGIGGGHDEREQTLNQLLVEMDGFDTKEGVILMAATNRPDILDRALLRPGRFDRRVVLDLPDVKGRYEILKVHARKIKIDSSVELMDVARNTPGSSGADLENILNEAALLAARKGRSAVTAGEVMEACDKVRFGKERRSLELDEQERKKTAFHEAGHAIVGLNVKSADPVEKVTIIPRGFSLGATHFLPKKNRVNYWKSEALDFLAISLGGRAAEEVFVKDISSGAQQDITQATKLARAMICEWGMSEHLGTISYDERAEGGQYLGIGGYHEKNYSEETAKIIDKEVFQLVNEAHKRALDIVEKNKEKVQVMSEMLMEFETLDALDIKEILDGNWEIAKKRERVKIADEKYKKNTPPPAPKFKEKPEELSPGNA